MKIRIDWYKPSGKWYEINTVDIPDDVYSFSPELAQLINPDKSLWESRAKQGFFLVIDNADIYSPKFFRALWTPDTFMDRFNKVNNYVPLKPVEEKEYTVEEWKEKMRVEAITTNNYNWA